MAPVAEYADATEINIDARQRGYVAMAGHRGDEQAEANAHRIVACVNACEGLADPSVVPELVKAASRVVDVVREYGSYDGQIADATERLAAILAKAEGR